MEYTVNIPEWQLKDVDNTLRMVSNAFESSKKETCLDRCIVQAQEYVKKALAVPSSPVMSKEEFNKLHGKCSDGKTELGSTYLKYKYEGYLIGTRSIVPEIKDPTEQDVKHWIKTECASQTLGIGKDDVVEFTKYWLRSQINK